MVAVEFQATRFTMEHTFRQLQFDRQFLTALRTRLTGILRWHLVEMFAIAFGYPIAPVKEHAPRCVRDGLGKIAVLNHVAGFEFLSRLLELIVQGQMSRLVLTHKDRLLRFGADLIFRICELKGIEIVIINKGEQPSFEEELTCEVMEIMTVFCAKLYGRRSDKSKKLAEAIENIVSEEKAELELDFATPKSTDRTESE